MALVLPVCLSCVACLPVCLQVCCYVWLHRVLGRQAGNYDMMIGKKRIRIKERDVDWKYSARLESNDKCKTPKTISQYEWFRNNQTLDLLCTNHIHNYTLSPPHNISLHFPSPPSLSPQHRQSFVTQTVICHTVPLFLSGNAASFSKSVSQLFNTIISSTGTKTD